MKKRIMNKIFRLSLIMIIAMCVIGIAGCRRTNNPPVHETICPGCKKTEVVHEKCPTCSGYTCVGNHNHVQIVCPGCKKEGISHPTCPTCKGYMCVGNHSHTPQPEPVSIEITNETKIISGRTIELNAKVIGVSNKEVTWEIVSGSEYVTLEGNQLSAKEVTKDQEIEIKVTSVENKELSKTQKFSIVAIPVLTQEMLDALNVDKIGFDGYLQIDLYTISLFEEFYSTYTSALKTAMDGTNWYAEYLNAETGTKNSLYYKNHEGISCQVGVSLMNEELYSPQLDDNGLKISWIESGLYNNFKGLTLSDFTFDEETWRYTYTGSDSTFITRVSASANPYDFVPVSLSLIIEDGELMGIKIVGKDSYTVAQGYRAVQELNVFINTDQNMEVPSVNKYPHDPAHHDALNEAINNMKALNSYTLDFEKLESVYGSTPQASGYQEIVTKDVCLFTPYEVSVSNGSEIHTPIETSRYGMKKISDTLYNKFTKQNDGYVATRAYEENFSNAKASFAFAGEIFRTYSYDEETETTTLYALWEEADPFTVITNGYPNSDLKFTYDSALGAWVSGNKGEGGSKSYLTITAIAEVTVTFQYKVSTESGWDKMYIKLNGSTKKTESGEVDYTTYTITLQAGDKLEISYEKDGSGDNGSDQVYIKDLTIAGQVVTTIE